MSPDEPDEKGTTPGEMTPGAGNWSPELIDLQRRGGMSPDWHEVTHGRGKGVGEIDDRSETDARESSGGPPKRKGQPRVAPPRLFRDVARRIGFQPPNRPPSPPKIPVDDWVAPENRPPDFWDPEVDGGLFEENTTWEWRPPEQHGEEPRQDEFADPPPRVEPGPAHGFTADAIAYYHPWHIGGDNYWGIYFREEHMNRYVERVERLFGWTGMRDLVVEQVLWHEMEHFEQEKAATALEDLLGESVYPTWLSKRYGIPVQLEDHESGTKEQVHMIEEALATAREIEWAEDPERNLPPDYAEFIAWDARSAPIGYRDFYLCLGEEAKQEARAAFLESVASVAQLGPGYRLNGETAKRLFGNRARTFKSVPIAWVDH